MVQQPDLIDVGPGAVVISPQPGPQEAVLASPADIVISGGAAGGGKTYSLLMEPLRWLEPMRMVGDQPIDFRAVIFRRKMTEVTAPGALWDVSNEVYGQAKGTPWITPSRRWLWVVDRSRLEVRFGHLEQEKNVYDWQGSQLTMVGFDELTEFSEHQFWYLQSRLRTTDPRIKPYVRATTNPDADSWVAKLIEWWIDQDTGYAIPERSGVIRWFIRRNNMVIWADHPDELLDYKDSDGVPIQPKSLTFIPSTLDDNPLMPREYVRELEAQDTVDVERLRRGNWKIRPSAGMYFKREWLGEPIDTPPKDLIAIVRGWDLAATEPHATNKDPDWTCGTKIGVDRAGRFYVLHHTYDRLNPAGVEQLIKTTAAQDGRHVAIAIPKDPAQAGKSQAATLAKLLAGYNVMFPSAAGDKLTRFKPFSAQCGAKNVSVVRGAWNERWFSQLENFPPPTKNGHDDDADSTSEAFNALVIQPGQPMVGQYSMR